MPPARGMGPRWTLRRSGLSTQPRRRQMARQTGVTASVKSRAETANTTRESMEFSEGSYCDGSLLARSLP